MPERYSVEAVLSAVDKSFTSNMNKASSLLDRVKDRTASSSAGFVKMGTIMGVASSVTSSALSAVSNAVGNLIGDLSQGSATWKTFNANMQNIGKSDKEIANVKKELQDFATKTIYSASEMATTYSQLAAVGIKSTDKLVKGFGGLAAAAENPSQAMKTLSQQATQMAAKPAVQWQDFKLMLEQTPAGIAAVAKQMGMSTAEMVTAVQDGTIKTQDFFDAVTAVGTSDTFTNMATEYKTLGQAFDGLQETVTNKLQPAFDKFSQKGIDKISKLVDKVSEMDFDKIINQFTSMDSILKTFGPALAVLGSGASLSGILPVVGGINSGFSTLGGKTKGVVSGLSDIASKGKELAGKVNLTNFAKGFETARGKLDGFRIGMLDVSDVFGNVDKGFLKVSSGVIDLQEKFPKLTSLTSKFSSGIGKGFQKSASVGMTAMSGMINGLTSVMGLALSVLGPAAIVAVVIAGLGVANQQFGGQIDAMIKTAVTKGPEVINKFVAGIVSALPALMESGTQLIAKFSEMFATLLPVVAQAGLGILGALITGLTSNMDSLITSVLTIVQAIGTTILEAAPALLMMGMDLLLSLVQGISANSGQIVTVVTGLINTFTQNITGNLPQIIDKGIEILTTLAKAAADTLPKLIPVAIKAISTLVTTLGNKLPDIMSAAVDIIMTLVDGFLDNLPEIASSAGELITTLLGALGKALPDIVAKGAELIASIVKGIWDHRGDIVNAGKDLVQGFINGIGDMIGNVKDKAAEMAKSAVDTVKSWLHIGSPSKVLKKIGAWTGEGFVIGMDGMVRDVEKTSERLANAALPDIGASDYGFDYALASSGAFASTMTTENKNAGRPIEVTVVSEIDGRQVSKATVRTDQEEQAKYNKIRNRVKGV